MKAQIITILVLFILALIVIMDYYFQLNIGLYIGIVVVYAGSMAYGSIVIQSNFFLPSVSKADNSGNMLAITFDDGPDATFTPGVLDILKKYNVRATFFVVGSRAEQNSELLKRIHNEGHLIGGHSYSHHYLFDIFSVERMQKELRKTEKVILETTGNKINLFRPPYGVTNPMIAKAVRAMNYQSIGWSLKSKDTMIKDSNILLSRLKEKLHGGAIVLFHDNRAVVADILEPFLKYVEDQQYSIVPLDQMININAYAN